MAGHVRRNTHQAQLDSAVALIGARAVRGDGTDAADLARLFAVVGQAGKLDILVTSSGVSAYSTLEKTTGAHLDKAFDLNVRGMVLTVTGARPLMDQGATIVLVGSIAGNIGNVG